VAGFLLFFLWLGAGGDFIAYLMTYNGEPGAYRHTAPVLALIMTGIAVCIVAYSRRYGADRVLWSCGAREILEPSNPQEVLYLNVVEEMCIASGQPMPRTFIVRDDDPNAFVTGR